MIPRRSPIFYCPNLMLGYYRICILLQCIYCRKILLPLFISCTNWIQELRCLGSNDSRQKKSSPQTNHGNSRIITNRFPRLSMQKWVTSPISRDSFVRLSDCNAQSFLNHQNPKAWLAIHKIAGACHQLLRTNYPEYPMLLPPQTVMMRKSSFFQFGVLDPWRHKGVTKRGSITFCRAQNFWEPLEFGSWVSTWVPFCFIPDRRKTCIRRY